MYRGGVRTPAVRPQEATSRTFTFPAPVRGWVTNENLSQTRPGSCLVLDNWFPTRKGARLRGGAKKVATVGSDPLKRLFTYESAAVQKLFAATETDVYDLAGFDPDTAPSADISSLTNGAWSTQQIGTAGGTYLVMVNGADTARKFDGSSWSTTAFTGSGLTATDLNYVWLYRNRLWFIEADTLSAWYGATSSIAGALSKLSLAGIFQRGGSLLFGATWSLDAGDGIDDKAVFVTDQGEVAIFEGPDPGDSAWQLVGRYDISPPMGPNAFMRAGGDLLIATYDGLIPISQAINMDKEALALASVSNPIEPSWLREVQDSTIDTQPWEIVRFPREDMLIVSLPHTNGERLFVANLHTGAWARYTGWDAQCLTTFSEIAYFGDSSGSIYRCESGGQDGDAPYTAQLCYAFDHLRTPAAHKQVSMARATLRSFFETLPKVSVASDYDTDFPTAPNAYTGAVTTAALFGSAIWGTSLFGDEGEGVGADQKTISTRWRSVARNGFAIAPQLQVTMGASWRPDTEVVAVDIVYETGGIVV